MPDVLPMTPDPDAAVSHKLQLSYRLLFERNPLPMWVYDVQTLRMLAVNEAAVAQYGYSKQEFVGLSLLDLQPEGDPLSRPAHLGPPLAQQPHVGRWQHRHASGELLEVELVTEELEFDGVCARMALVRDMTPQRHAEAMQRELAQRLTQEQQTLISHLTMTVDALISTDLDGRIQLFNPGAERIFRCTAESLQGQFIDVLLPERFRLAHQAHRRQLGASGGAERMMGWRQVRGLRADGQELELEGLITPVTLDQTPLLMLSLRDVSDRHRVDAECRQSQALLSELTQKLMTQEKTLVKRLAQALHDQLGQTIAAIRMAHETIMAVQAGQVPAGVERLQAQMSTLIAQAIRQIRQVLIDLRPPLLDEHGLAAALDNELRNRALTQPQIDISINVPPELSVLRWPLEVEYATFMVAREAVENALRHSGASAVSVLLSGTPCSLQLEVADNGVGMAAGDAQRAGHLGILSMQERAQAMGATVTVDSAQAPGTRVRLNWKSVP